MCSFIIRRRDNKTPEWTKIAEDELDFSSYGLDDQINMHHELNRKPKMKDEFAQNDFHFELNGKIILQQVVANPPKEINVRSHSMYVPNLDV